MRCQPNISGIHEERFFFKIMSSICISKNPFVKAQLKLMRIHEEILQNISMPYVCMFYGRLRVFLSMCTQLLFSVVQLTSGFIDLGDIKSKSIYIEAFGFHVDGMEYRVMMSTCICEAGKS